MASGVWAVAQWACGVETWQKGHLAGLPWGSGGVTISQACQAGAWWACGVGDSIVEIWQGLDLWGRGLSEWRSSGLQHWGWQAQTAQSHAERRPGRPTQSWDLVA
jgi:hypothetical protein